jgi:hypothetical protein
MMLRSAWLYLFWPPLWCVLGLLRVASVRAEPCALPAGAAPALSQQSSAERLDFLADSLHSAAQRERRFAMVWSLGYAGLGAGSWVLLPLSSDPQQRTDAIYSSASSLFGALVVLIEPLRVIRQQRRLETLLRAAGTTAAPERCALLESAERLLAAAAESEASAHGPLSHIGGVLFNLGLGLGLAYGLHRPDSAAVNTTVGILLGELMIATRPSLAVERWASYRQGELSRSHRSSAISGLSLLALPVRSGDGLALALSGAY